MSYLYFYWSAAVWVLAIISLAGVLGAGVGVDIPGALAFGSHPYNSPEAFGVWSAPLVMTQDRIYTHVSVDGGSDKLFMVDNGYRYVTFTPSLARGVGFEAVGETATNVIDRRRVRTPIGTVRRLGIGGLEVDDMLVQVCPIMHTLSNSLGLRIHGVVGTNLMARYLTTIDFEEDRIVFTQRTPSSRARLLAEDGAVALPFGPHPFSSGSCHIFSIRIRINGVPVDAIVDLGFTGGILTNLAPRELGLRMRSGDLRGFPVAIAGYRGTGRMAVACTVTVGNSSTSDVPVIVFYSRGAPSFVIVGVQFLNRFKPTFDFAGRSLILRPVSD